MRPKGRLFSFYRYAIGKTPWDSGKPKPMMLTFLAESGLAPGKALDLGCGTGTNLIALAERGWRGMGIDHVGQPLIRARAKARSAGVSDQISFRRGDIRKLTKLKLHPPYDLALDLGCSHSLSEADFTAYLCVLAGLIRAGGELILFAYLPAKETLSASLDQQLVLITAAPYYDLIRLEEGRHERKPSCWYHLKRKDERGDL